MARPTGDWSTLQFGIQKQCTFYCKLERSIWIDGKWEMSCVEFMRSEVKRRNLRRLSPILHKSQDRRTNQRALCWVAKSGKIKKENMRFRCTPKYWFKTAREAGWTSSKSKIFRTANSCGLVSSGQKNDVDEGKHPKKTSGMVKPLKERKNQKGPKIQINATNVAKSAFPEEVCRFILKECKTVKHQYTNARDARSICLRKLTWRKKCQAHHRWKTTPKIILKMQLAKFAFCCCSAFLGIQKAIRKTLPKRHRFFSFAKCLNFETLKDPPENTCKNRRRTELSWNYRKILQIFERIFLQGNVWSTQVTLLVRSWTNQKSLSRIFQKSSSSWTFSKSFALFAKFCNFLQE